MSFAVGKDFHFRQCGWMCGWMCGWTCLWMCWWMCLWTCLWMYGMKYASSVQCALWIGFWSLEWERRICSAAVCLPPPLRGAAVGCWCYPWDELEIGKSVRVYRKWTISSKTFCHQAIDDGLELTICINDLHLPQQLPPLKRVRGYAVL